MIIDEIVLHNFGVYKGHKAIQLTPTSKNKPIILFGGKNGAGKTTFLDALLLALHGKNAHCSNRGAFSYENYLRKCINYSISPREGASLEIQFRHISDSMEHSYRVRRSWALNGKNIREDVEVSKDQRLDRLLTDFWNEYVEEYIPFQIANLFFFDGERIEAFADLENSSQLLSTAIHSLLGLDIVDKLSNDLKVFERRKSISIKTEEEKKEIDKAEAELKQIEFRRRNLVQSRASMQNDLDYQRKRLRNTESNYLKKGGELFEQREELETKKITIQEHIKNTEAELREIASDAAPLMLVKNSLNTVEEQGYMEDTAQKAQALTEVLKERDEKIMQIIQKNQASEKLIKNLNEFLNNDRDSLGKEAEIEPYLNLNKDSMKKIQNLRENILPALQIHSKLLLEKTKEMHHLLDDIDRKLASIPDPELLAPIIKERDSALDAIEEIEKKMKILAEELNYVKREYEQKRAQIINQIEKTVESNFKQEDILRTLYHTKKVQETINKFRKNIIYRHVDRIEKLIFDSFKQLIRKQNFIKELSIDPESYKLELRGTDGKVISTDRLSAGERQILAVSILWGLIRASGRALPTAIDTPLGRLDSSHRSHIVERYFPHAGHQVLLFSTDEEINTNYFQKLKPYIGRSYLMEYNEEQGSSEINPGYFF